MATTGDTAQAPTAATTAQPETARTVHPHPIRWDIDQQLWVCSVGCGFNRPKREGEVVPSREDAQDEARRAGTGSDFSDLRPRATAGGSEPPTDTQPQVPAAG
ncbi:MAG: hypothetical protein AVDCRST_MAG77-2481 [uncultured Chloroflexi bacterium]|uniref:Uncharacterized protein n=1 Tax=uncultured Chloroflexota bacterium TaxID=166587 RepID=A0A6J4IN00_9CHLR|nr:MAG: hypothetical protein AVDCRST_MAG77-2481 [uncultured Chloroflexota bacterium]